MIEFATMTKRVLVAAIVAIAMSVGVASIGLGSASAVSRSSGAVAAKSVVGKSDAGKITSTVVGKTSAGDRVTGSFTPIRTVERDGVLYMKGFLKGVIKDAGPDTRFSGVKLIPVKKINGQRVTDARTASRAAACDVLNLVLGPLDLNVLGLEVHLQRVVLDIVAVAGAGQLLGNLLCAVAGLLDGGPLAGLLGQLRNLLNQILGALNLGV
jgi:hypothetical protein